MAEGGAGVIEGIQALFLRLSQHRNHFTSPPLALALSAIINNKIQVHWSSCTCLAKCYQLDSIIGGWNLTLDTSYISFYPTGSTIPAGTRQLIPLYQSISVKRGDPVEQIRQYRDYLVCYSAEEPQGRPCLLSHY